MEQRTSIIRCDDCLIEHELFKDLVGPACPHRRPSASRHHRLRGR